MYGFTFQRKYMSENLGKGLMVLQGDWDSASKAFFTANVFHDFYPSILHENPTSQPL